MLGARARLTSRRTAKPPFLISSMASPWVMFFVVCPLISINWSPTRNLPSSAAGPEIKMGVRFPKNTKKL